MSKAVEFGIMMGLLAGLMSLLLGYLSGKRFSRYMDRLSPDEIRALKDVSSLEIALIIMGRLLPRSLRKGRERSSNQPPRTARLLARFLIGRKDQEALLGDLNEIYSHIAKEDGTRVAQRWYFWQVICSVVAINFNRIKHVGIIAAIGEAIRRFTS